MINGHSDNASGWFCSVPKRAVWADMGTCHCDHAGTQRAQQSTGGQPPGRRAQGRAARTEAQRHRGVFFEACCTEVEPRPRPRSSRYYYIAPQNFLPFFTPAIFCHLGFSKMFAKRSPVVPQKHLPYRRSWFILFPSVYVEVRPGGLLCTVHGKLWGSETGVDVTPIKPTSTRDSKGR